MAFSTLNLKHPEYEVVKQAPVGFSWTVFFFSFFPPLFRGDWKWGMIILIAALFTFGISTFVFMFAYNKLFLQSLLDQGYTSVDSEEVLNPIEAKLGMKIPRKLSISDKGSTSVHDKEVHNPYRSKFRNENT